ncbi:hypothetical protein ACP4OV_022091 [Aristida adscensionis]
MAEKVSSYTRTAVVALLVVGLLLAAAPEAADAKSPTTSSPAKGFTEQKTAADRAPEQANKYTRGCNAITGCRGA